MALIPFATERVKHTQQGKFKEIYCITHFETLDAALLQMLVRWPDHQGLLSGLWISPTREGCLLLQVLKGIKAP